MSGDIARFIASIPEAVDIKDLAAAAAGARLQFGIHLAVLVEPYLSYIMDGTKTVESRFSRTKAAPYKQVRRGDAVLLKRSGGPVVGYCRVIEPMFLQLDAAVLAGIKKRYGREIRAPDSFWQEHEVSRYATLLRIDGATPVSRPIAVAKRDQRGWIVLRAGAVKKLW